MCKNNRTRLADSPLLVRHFLLSTQKKILGEVDNKKYRHLPAAGNTSINPFSISSFAYMSKGDVQ